MMFGRLKEADLMSNREDKHGLKRGPNVRETCFALGKGIREDFTWEDTFELHLTRRGDFQTKRGRGMPMCRGRVIVPFMTKGWGTSFQ